SRCLLQSLLGRSASLHSGRAAQNLLGGTIVPAHHAKRASLLSLLGAVLSRRARDRRLEGALVFRRIRNRRRHDGPRDQCCPARRLHVWVSLATALGRRISRSIFPVANMLSRLCMRNLFQPPPHALGVAKSVLGRFCRSVRSAVRDGHLARCAAILAVVDSQPCLITKVSSTTCWSLARGAQACARRLKLRLLVFASDSFANRC